MANTFKKHKYIIDGKTFYAFNYNAALAQYRRSCSWN